MLLSHKHRRLTARRVAFSLVELLVAMALIVFIMSVLSAAFAAGTKAFRDLKASGDLAERLRGAIVLMRRDLSSPHFDGNRRLSDASFWRYGPGTSDFGPPPEGFFRLWQDQRPLAQWTGLPDQVVEYTATRTALHFSVRLPGKAPGEFFSTQLPTGSPLLTLGGQEGFEQRFMDGATQTFRSQWAEVVWWLTPAVDAVGQQEVTKSDGPQATFVPQPLYILRRRQLLMWSGSGVGTSGNIEAQLAQINNDEVSSRPGSQATTVYVNKPKDVTLPPFRWNMLRAGAAQPLSYAGWPANPTLGTNFPPNLGTVPPPNIYPAESNGGANPAGRVEDIVLNNVLSMDVRLLLQNATDFVDLFDPSVQPFGVSGGSPRNPVYPFNTTTPPQQGPLVFDTWSRANLEGYDYETNWNTAGQTAAIPLYMNQAGQRIRVRAILISLRIWDQKSLQSRQVTLVQDL